MTCDLKHTKYQPTDEEWKCPKCGTPPPLGLIIDDGPGIETDCVLIHPEDYLRCDKCGYDTTGKAWAAFVAKRTSRIPCPHCEGKGWVKP